MKIWILFTLIVSIMVPIANADTNDVIDGFMYYGNACAGHLNGVWVDTDGRYNGATYGNYDTMVVFQTVTGLGYPVKEYGSDTKKWYYFTPNALSCGVGSLDKARQVIYFVDMLASGFSTTNPSTWIFKSVPGISIMSYHDEWFCSGQPYGGLQLYAYRNRYQSGFITGTTTTNASFPGRAIHNFSDPLGIKELYVSSDYCENHLNNFIIISGTTTIKGDIDGNGQITASDALLYLRYAVSQNIAPYSMSASDDVTCDGVVHADDALKVLRKAVGQSVNLAC